MKYIIIVILFVPTILSPKERQDTTAFSKYEYGFFGGVNFGKTSESGVSILVEVKSNILDNLFLSLGAGYSKIFSPQSFSYKTYSSATIEKKKYYFAEEFKVNEKMYDEFPFSLALQYSVEFPNISPYVLLGINYNIIDAKLHLKMTDRLTFNSLNEIPEEFKLRHFDELPTNSLGVVAGVGTTIVIFNHVNLIFRYFYKIDNKIINTHQFLTGVSF